MINIKRVFILSILLSCFFLTNEVVAQKVNALDASGQRDGNWKKYYENGRLRYTGNFKNGKEIGTFLFFTELNSKSPAIIKIFKENSNTAKVEHLTATGKTRSSGEMIGKNRVGKWTYFFPDGKLFSEENYVKGKLDGLLTNYYNNGKKTEETFYKGGVKNGTSKKYTDTGLLLEHISFANGKQNGEAQYFDVKGNLKEKGNYSQGKRIGKWDFFMDGEVVSKKKRKTHTISKQ